MVTTEVTVKDVFDFLVLKNKTAQQCEALFLSFSKEELVKYILSTAEAQVPSEDTIPKEDIDF